MTTKQDWLDALAREERKRRRDRFAGLALQGMLADGKGERHHYATVAAEAVKYADALLRALDTVGEGAS